MLISLIPEVKDADQGKKVISVTTGMFKVTSEPNMATAHK